jgi:hypothetical protein
MKTYKVLGLAMIGVIGMEELENDSRKHDFYHIEQRGYESPETVTRQAMPDSGVSGSGSGGAVTLPRLRVQASGIFVGQQ